MTKKTAIKILQILIPVLCLWWVYSRGALDFGRIWDSIVDRPSFLLLAIAVSTVALLLGAVRWRSLVVAQAMGLSVRDAFSVSLISFFFTIFLPGIVGSDLVRGIYLDRLFPGQRSGIVASVLLDRALGLYGLLIIGLVAVIGNLDRILASRELCLLAGASLAVFLIGTSAMLIAWSKSVRTRAARFRLVSGTKLGQSLDRLAQAFFIYRSRPGVIISAIGNAVLVQGLYIFILFLLGVMLAGTSRAYLGFWDTLLAAPLALLANALPISPNGIGVGEVAFARLWEFFGLGNGADVSLLSRFVYTVVALPGAYVYLRRSFDLKLRDEGQGSACT